MELFKITFLVKGLKLFFYNYRIFITVFAVKLKFRRNDSPTSHLMCAVKLIGEQTRTFSCLVSDGLATWYYGINNLFDFEYLSDVESSLKPCLPQKRLDVNLKK